MPKIVINEIDETSPGRVAESFEVVYIPGFVDLGQDNLYDYEPNEETGITEKKGYIGIPYAKPTLFTSVASFVTACGGKPAVFESDQFYTDVMAEEPDGGISSFARKAIPYDNVMFKEGSPDPSYIIAKELLAAGLNVMYERVNPEKVVDYASNLKLLAETDEHGNNKSLTKADIPHWDRVYKSYAVATFGEPKPTQLTKEDIAPDFEKYVSEGVVFYKLDKSSTSTSTLADAKYIVVPEEPEDWDVSYYNYYYNKYSSEPAELSTPDNATVIPYSGTISIKTMYAELPRIFDASNKEGLMDRGNYNVKYITSGGYPTFEFAGNSIVNAMKKFCSERGDCYALIDHTDCQERNLNIDAAGSLYQAVVKAGLTTFNEDGEFATMFTPWAEYTRTTMDYDYKYSKEDDDVKANKIENFDPTITLAASFAYLTSLADSIKTNAPWLAIAGAARGGVKNLSSDGMTTIISNGAADGMQPRQGMSINGITNIRPYGNIIWGNRTLKHNDENLTATSFLNIRNLVCDVKKVVYQTARRLTFEQNNDVLWVNFKAGIVPTLERMLSGAGISNYKIVRDYENKHAVEKGVVCAKIFLYPIYPVEDFYITVVLKDDEIIVE